MASTGNNTPPLTAYQCHQRGACWRRCLFEFIAGMSHVSEFQPSWLTVDGQVIMPSSKRLRRLPSHTYQQPTLEMWPGQSSFLHVSSTWTENTSKSARSQGQRRKKKKDQASTWERQVADKTQDPLRNANACGRPPHPPLWRAYSSTLRSPKSLEKHSVSRLSYLFSHLHLLSSYSFSSTLLSSNLSLLSASSLLCFSSVHIVGSLTSKLPSIVHMHTCCS